MSYALRACLACFALLAAACLPPRLTVADGAAGTGGAADAMPEAPPEAPPALPKHLALEITADENDALWIDGDDERLHYSETNPTIEVGMDGEMGRTGLRFALAMPAGAHVTAAVLRLHRHSSELAGNGPSAIAVQVYDSVDVAPFDEAHTHPPEQHDARGLWGKTIDGFMVTDDDATVATPDLSQLVQRIVDRGEWTGAGAIGFVLSPQQGRFPAPGWVAFDDFFSGSDWATLELTYVAP